ncbi:hypothetical protein HPP92_005853 [Vanilla planifolia]|uniref:Uncharacterized protein n=1 Tax=Vanilla planifolia TaxID=51239 RepID=A0A835RLH9_VANPL|nr:hypothetical protein HPP92_006116 [Vanilla planifolia]KAG0494859.1 hypothetical protein HPP92_005853 [Vanilla planifolia]
MAAPLLDLSEVLRSRTDKDKVTTSESTLISGCMVKAVKKFFTGAILSSALVYSATSRLGGWYRFYLSAGSAMVAGRLMLDRSANACLEQILGMEGSRMQRELANIILKKYRGSPSRMQLVYKHFYPERVFGETDLDKPFLRWRIRNGYVDGNASRRREDHCDSGDLLADETTSSEQSVGNVGADLLGDFLVDPLDCILGDLRQDEGFRHADAEEVPRRRPHRHRAARRHRRAEHSES